MRFICAVVLDASHGVRYSPITTTEDANMLNAARHRRLSRIFAACAGDIYRMPSRLHRAV